MDIHTGILLAAFVVALVMGAVAARTNFCTLGAVSDWVNIGDTGRMRAWVFAMAVALIGVTALEAAGILTIGGSTFPPYRTANFAWLRYIVGGLLFGIGMTLGSGCGSKTLIRIGGGNVKSLVVLISAAVCAYLLLWTPVFEKLFLPWIAATTIDLTRYGMQSQELGAILAGMFGLEPGPGWLRGVALVAAAAMLVFVFKSPDFRGNREHMLGGAVVGLAIVAGWYLTGSALGQSWKDAAEMAIDVPSRVQTQSYTFIAPMGDTIRWLMSPGQTHLVNFGMAGFAGVVLGSLAYALATRRFAVEKFLTVKDFGNHVLGGALMGIGGIVAMGCTFGQAITGVSTLAAGSLLAFASMVIGCAGTMKFIFWRMMREV